MGGTEPVDSAPAGTRLGARLRQLRQERGMSQREFTRLIGLSAHSNLADYESGRRVPPQDVVRACERALELPAGELEALRRADKAAIAAREHRRPETGGDRDRSRRRRTLIAVVAGIAVLAVGVGVAVGLLVPRSDSPGPVVGLSTCDRGAVILDSARLRTIGTVREDGRTVLAPGALVGTVALRFSPGCALGWTRFVPAADVDPGAGTVTLEVHRIADGATTTLRLTRIVGAESDPLLTVAGCVYAQAAVRFGDGSTVSGQTRCYQRG